MMDVRYQVKQYVAVVKNRWGNRFMVFRTGDDKFYLFQPVDADLCATSLPGFPVEKKRLVPDMKRALAHGWGNAGARGE